MLKNLSKKIYMSSVLAIAFFAFVLSAATMSVSAQPGKGGKGKHGGNGNEKHEKHDKGDRGKNRGRDDFDSDRRSQGRSDNESRRQQQLSDWNARRQQKSSDNESRRQQQISDWNSRRQQADSDRNSRRQQQVSDWNARRQQQINEWNARRQQQINEWNSRRQQQSDRRDDDRRRDYRVVQNDRRVIYGQPQGQPSYGWNRGNGWGNRNYYWQQSKRIEKQERRLLKDERKAQQRYDTGQRLSNQSYYGAYPSQSYPYNDNNYSGYSNNSGWRDQIFRTLIANVLGGGFDNGSGGSLSRYVPTENRGYAYNTPNYSYNQPSQRYYGVADSYYGGYDEPTSFNAGSILGALPIAEIVQQYTGDNEFVSQLIGGFLTQGYDQGYLAGETARESGYENADYNDPYSDQGNYDPYSATTAENRRYLSEGYSIGYRDAMAGNTGYDPQTEGSVDLVSALLNNVLSGV